MKSTQSIGSLLSGMCLLGIWCYFSGRPLWAGGLYVVVGAASLIRKRPYSMYLVLVGFTPILQVTNQRIILWIISGLIIMGSLVDVLRFIALTRKRDIFKLSIEERNDVLRKNEATFRLWNASRRLFSKEVDPE